MKLKTRHIQMIAIGGAIGTGLFYGAAKSIQLTGPSILLSYFLGGIIMYIIMRALGEMTVHSPNSGAFSHYAYRYVGEYLGFLSGWFAWFEYTIVCMLELTVVASFLDYWIPGVPHWLTISIILSVFFFINILEASLFGEFEFWFTGIKVITIIGMIAFSVCLILFNADTHIQAINNIKDTFSNNLFAHGISGFMYSMVLVLFSFGGVQFIGIAAADAENPNNCIPKAVNGVIFRILIFYMGTIFAILCLYPWQKLQTEVSPFIDVFDQVGFHFAAQIMSIVVITAALSAFNSCLYAGGRMLANLATHQGAPRYLSKKDRNNVPKRAVITTSLIIALTVILNYLLPDKALIYLIGITTTSIIITWMTILITHLNFRKTVSPKAIFYKLPLHPYTNYLVLLLLTSLMVVMFFMDDMKIAVFLMPIWIGIITLLYYANIKMRSSKTAPMYVD